MSTPAARRAAPRLSAATLLAIGLVVGSLDIGDNLIYNAVRHITPAMVFRYIASGLLGPAAAVHAGYAAVALGVVMHYAIAIFWVVLFYRLARRFAVLLRRPLISGPLYGAGVYLFMNLVAVPLSRLPPVRSAVTLTNRINGILAVVLLVGLGSALLVRRSLRRAP
ncbi:MAG TPA: hypothetical protein VN515_10070 [Terriglobales bacterium]|nr:hypothetical protein [Terriglobales bacterium]